MTNSQVIMSKAEGSALAGSLTTYMTGQASFARWRHASSGFVGVSSTPTTKWSARSGPLVQAGSNCRLSGTEALRTIVVGAENAGRFAAKRRVSAELQSRWFSALAPICVGTEPKVSI
jgi:hypothetical protein